MALTTKSLSYNLITAELDGLCPGEARRTHGERGMAKFKYGDLDHFPKVLVYGGMKLVTRSRVEGMYGARTPCIDIKDDEMERFFINLVETLLRVGGGCINEKPWKIESPLMGCGGSYTIKCMVTPSSKLGPLDFGEYRRGWCELRVFAACRYGIGIVVEEVKL